MATKLVNGVRVDVTAQDIAEQAQRNTDTDAAEQARLAREATRQERLTDIPANEQSMIAIRSKINEILALLRGD